MPKSKNASAGYAVWLRTAAIGTAGGATATYLGIPLSWMLGALFATGAVALAKIPLAVPKPVRLYSRIFIGLILGAAINADTLGRIGQWPGSLALLVVGMTAVTALTTLYYTRLAGLDRLTATAASLPGGMSSVAAIAIEQGAQAAPTVMGQLFRLTAVVVLIPLLYGLWLGEAPSLPMQEGPSFWLGENLWVVLLALPVYWLGRVIRLPSAEMLAPMILSAGLGLWGYPLALPSWLFALVFVVLGSAIGARFKDIDRKTIASVGGHSVVATALTLCLVALLAMPMAYVADVPFHVALLAVAPGGIAEMVVLAIALGVDPVFVTFHQALRSILLNALAPFFLRWLQGGTAPRRP